jgi:hypothetical protein
MKTETQKTIAENMVQRLFDIAGRESEEALEATDTPPSYVSGWGAYNTLRERGIAPKRIVDAYARHGEAIRRLYGANPREVRHDPSRGDLKAALALAAEGADALGEYAEYSAACRDLAEAIA